MSSRHRLLGLTLIEALVILIIIVVFAAVLFPVTACAKCVGPKTGCLSSEKQIGIGAIMYATDHDDRWPLAANWMDGIRPYVRTESFYHDTDVPKQSDYGRAFRSRASGLENADFPVPSKYISFFDSDLLGRNASSELWSIPRPGRHKGWDTVDFLDGHAKGVNPETEATLFRKFLSEDDQSGPVDRRPLITPKGRGN